MQGLGITRRFHQLVFAFAACFLTAILVSGRTVLPDDLEKRYDVVFTTYPMPAAEAAKTPPHLFTPIRQANGTAYLCRMPNESLERETGPDSEGGQAVPVDVVVALNRHLNSKRGDVNTCSLHHTVYWSYQFCFGRFVREYHTEDKVPPDPSVGTYLGYAAPELAAMLDAKEAFPPYVRENLKPAEFTAERDSKGKYWSSWMEGGTLCDVTGLPRRTELQVRCPIDVNYFGDLQLEELSHCVYRLTFYTKIACSFMSLAPEPPMTHTITCYPLSNYSL